jgi:hypothetical protein
MAMKKDEMVVLGLAGVAVYMILKSNGLNGILGTSVAGQPPRKPSSPSGDVFSPWFGLGNPGYSLFDGKNDSLGLASSPQGTGLGLKMGSTGLGMSYGGVKSSGGYGITGSW